MKRRITYIFALLAFCVQPSSVRAAEDIAAIYENAQKAEKENPDSALFYYSYIVSNPETLKKQPEIAGKSYRRLALLTSQKDIDKAMEFCRSADIVFQQLNNIKEQGITYNTVANIYQRKGYFDLSIQNYLKAAALFEKINFYRGLTICYSNIASIYNNTEQYQKNLVYNKLAYQTSLKEKDSFSIGMIAHDLSVAFVSNKMQDSAKALAAKALSIAQAIRDDFVQAYAYKAFTEYYLAANKPAEAQQSAAAYLSYILKTGAEYDICLAFIKNASIDLKLRRLPDAHSAIERGMEYAQRSNSFQLYKNLYALKKEYYAQSGDYKNAYLSAQLFQQYNDSVFSEKRNNTLNELETKYQTAKKETQIAQQQVKIKQAKTRLIISVILLAVLLAGGVLIYFFLRQRQVLLQNKIMAIEQQKKLELTQAIMDGEEQERMRLAKELHDGIGGLMSMIKLQFTNFKKSRTDIQNDHEYNTALDLLNTASQDIRKISHALMPSALERLGLVEALEQFCGQAEKSGHLEIDFQHYGLEERLPAKMELLAYRIVQELLNNILKYAAAKEVLIQVSKHEQRLSFAVEDDGNGFDVEIIKNKEGIGLHSMQKRIELMGGKMDIDSAIGKGTSVNIELPIT